MSACTRSAMVVRAKIEKKVTVCCRYYFWKKTRDRGRYTLSKNTEKPKWVLVTFFFFFLLLTYCEAESIILHITPKTRRVARPSFRVIIVVAMFPYVFIIDPGKARYEQTTYTICIIHNTRNTSRTQTNSCSGFLDYCDCRHNLNTFGRCFCQLTCQIQRRVRLWTSHRFYSTVQLLLTVVFYYVQKEYKQWLKTNRVLKNRTVC